MSAAVRFNSDPEDHDTTEQEELGPDATASAQHQAADLTAQRALKLRRSAFAMLLAADAVALSVALVCGQLIDSAINGRSITATFLATVAYGPLIMIVMAGYGLYRRGQRRVLGSSFPDISQLVHSLIVGALAVLFASGGFHRWLHLPSVDRTAIAFTAVIALVLVTQGRAAARGLVRWPVGSRSRVLIVGSGVVASRLTSRLTSSPGVVVVGCVDDSLLHVYGDDPPLLGGLDDITRLVATNAVDHVVVAFSPATGAALAARLRDLANVVQISVVPRLFDLLTVRSHVEDRHGLPVIDVAPASLGPADRFAKRALDVLASGLGLLLLSPLLAAISVGVKVTSPGPILFSQERAGRGGRPFSILKFRTMKVNAEAERQALSNEVDGPLFKVRSDPRVTSLGRFLRKTSLDELPQLLNVFKGDMSLVGPRPFITRESAEIAGWAARRLDVRPGITGLWQISGRNDLPFEELCRLDYSYVASWSIWWDLRILWHTPGVVLRRHGAY